MSQRLTSSNAPSASLISSEILDRRIVPIVGVHDALSAAIATENFKAVFLDGLGFVRSHYGSSDINMLTWSDMLDFTHRVKPFVSDKILFVDIYDGFGDVEFATKFVGQLCNAGATGVIISDSTISHSNNLVEKIEAISMAQTGLYIAAKIQVGAIDSLVSRAKKISAAGADAICISGVESLADLRELSGSIEIPIMVEKIVGSGLPDWTLQDLVSVGVSLVNFSNMSVATSEFNLVDKLATIKQSDGIIGSEIVAETIKQKPIQEFSQAVEDDGVQKFDGSDEVLYQAPVSSIQERMWFLHNFEEDKTIYNLGAAMSAEGPLNLQLLQEAFTTIVERHDSLRTVFKMVDEVPQQIVLKNVPTEIEHISVVNLSQEDKDKVLSEKIEELRIKPFDLDTPPLIELVVLSLSDNSHRLLYRTHHIVSDGWSISIFFAELSKAYADLCEGKVPELKPLDAQYSDFAKHERQLLTGASVEKDISYWVDKLKGELPVLEIPTDRPRPAYQTFKGSSFNHQISSELTDKLKKYSRQEGATLFMTLLAAFEVLMLRQTGSTDMCIGVPIAERNRSDFESLIGPLINTLVIRNDLEGEKTFSDLVRQVREECLTSFEHHAVPFEKVVTAVNPEREMSRPPIFQVLFSFRNFPESPFQMADVTLTPVEFERPTSKFDITLELVENGEGLLALIEYNTDLFDRTTIERMHAQYQEILEQVVEDASKSIHRIPILPADQERQLLVDWNDTSKGYDLNRSIHSLFENQVQKSPDAEALIVGSERLTYQELNDRANQMARFLVESGVKKESRVGIFMKRSSDMVVAMLGVLKAGGAYVPLDSAYPKDRIAFIVEDADLPVIITDNDHLNLLPESTAKVVSVDNEMEVLSQFATNNLDLEITGDDLVYVFYTSGSTGKPKGVALEHHNPVSLCLWASELFSAEEVDGVLFSTSICFDLSVFELFFTLSVGGKVILAENAVSLPTLEAVSEVSLVNTVPSIMAEVVKIGAVPPNCKTVTLCGEPLSGELVDDIYENKQVEKVYDLYGPSEDTTYSTVVLRQPKGPVTIGKPISETQAYVLDKNLQPVPIGVPGELHLAGAGLARGYLGRPELTAEKFIANPFSEDPEAKMYKTGDLVRYLADGNLEFLGRLDFQVKIRGFRIELGEIESALRKLSAVKEALVVAKPTKRGDMQLVAYVVYGEFELTVSELKYSLSKSLPEYMIPPVVIELDEFPLTPNGKMDRKALPEPTSQDTAPANLENLYPKSKSERAIAEIWKEVLEVSDVKVTDNFFDLGGHSLLSMRVIVRIEEQLGVSLNPRDIILQNLAQLAALCEERFDRVLENDKDLKTDASEDDVSGKADYTASSFDHNDDNSASQKNATGWKARFNKVRNWRGGRA